MDTIALRKFVERRLVLVDWGDYSGIKEPTVADLVQLSALVSYALSTATKADITGA